MSFFILFFLLISMGLTPPSLTLWKAQEIKPKITEVLVNRLLNGKIIHFNFEATLQHLFYSVAVLPSVQCGLISSENLTVSGDGTAVHTHATPRGHRLNPDPDKPYNPDVPRHFSDPDASWGWDSDMEKYYYGYTLFQLSCHNHSLHVDIPLLLRFTSAKRHDSVSFLVAFHEFEKHMPDLHISNMCLDSAMDNYPTYKRTLSPIAFVSALIQEGCLPCLFFTAALLNIISSARKPLYY